MNADVMPPIRTFVRVISLETSTERRAAFEAQASASQAVVPWRYYPARTDLAHELSYHAEDAMVAKGRALYPAELGVYSSHFTLWKYFLEEGADQLLVLEDDVVIDWDFVATLCACNLAELGLPYLKLFNKNITPFRVVSEHFHRRTLIDCRGYAHGMQSYMLTREGAQSFLRFCSRVRRPIDDEMDRSWAHGVPNIAVFPFPAFERHGPSTIGLARYDAHDIPLSLRIRRLHVRAQEKLRRGWQRIGGYGYGSHIGNRQGRQA